MPINDLGAFAPPMGVGLYATCAVCKVTVESVARPLLRYWAVIAVGLVLLAVIPPVSLWLPRLFGAS